MASEWYYQSADRVVGPIPWNRLKQLAQLGKLHPETLIRKGRDGVWLPAADFRSLGRDGRERATDEDNEAKLKLRRGLPHKPATFRKSESQKEQECQEEERQRVEEMLKLISDGKLAHLGLTREDSAELYRRFHCEACGLFVSPLGAKYTCPQCGAPLARDTVQLKDILTYWGPIIGLTSLGLGAAGCLGFIAFFDSTFPLLIYSVIALLGALGQSIAWGATTGRWYKDPVRGTFFVERLKWRVFLPILAGIAGLSLAIYRMFWA